MIVVEKNPIPIYEVTCDECKSKIQYKRTEVYLCYIQCPVCGMSVWANTTNPVRMADIKDCPKKEGELKLTNTDRIRAKSDEELADWITGLLLLEKSTGLFSTGLFKDISNEWLEWLRKEAE